jgi:phage-related protein
VKAIEFLGSSQKDLSSFPKQARKAAGFELLQVQLGRLPRDFKPMTAIGPGVEELRIWADSGTFRVIYLARLEDAVYVLHAFEKKTRTTGHADIELAKKRYRQLVRQ